MSLRELARGAPCMIRLAGICSHNPETTVLAHYRLPGTCGTGIKPPDELGAWACHSCHGEADRRTRVLESDFVKLAHAEAVMRTLYALYQDGYRMVKIEPKRKAA